MEKMINQDEVNALLAAEIRKVGLNDAIKLDMVKEKVLKKIQEMQGMTEMENPAVAQGPTTFINPEDDEEKFKVAPDIAQTDVPTEIPKVGMEAGAQPLNVPTEPKIAIVPEIPDFLKEVEPGKVFVYDFNELSVGGENLSNKPFKTMEDPSVSKSMQQMWSEKGITKAEVYQTKFEKIGDIIFDYKSGSSQFIERGAEPDLIAQQQYKENPYAADPTKEIESYIKQNIDIDQKVNDVISNIVKNYFLTNSERAVNDPNLNYTSIPTTHSSIDSGIPAMSPNGLSYPVSEGVSQTYIYTVSDMVNKLRKIDSPKELIESIEGKSQKAVLIGDNKEVKVYKINETKYFLPSNPMSIRKCYVE